MNCPSLLLNKSENDFFMSSLKGKIISLATGIAELYLTSGPNHQSFQKVHTGIVCFIRDSERRSYYIQIYSFKDNSILWEQELYRGFNFKVIKNIFISFEAHDCVAGLNFSSENEAKIFIKALKMRISKSETIKSKKDQVAKKNSKFGGFASNFLGKNKKNEKKKPTRLAIGGPVEFRHVGHIGCDSTEKFDKVVMDDSWKRLFQTLHVDEKMLEDKDTSQFIIDFVNQGGGIENFVKEIDQMEKEHKHIKTIDEPISSVSEAHIEVIEKPVNISPVSLGGVPPPPPPPISTPKAPATVIPPRTKSSSTTPTQASTPDSSNLLQQIQSGIALKKSPLENKKSENSIEPDDTMVSMLANRLNAMRSNVAEYDDDEDSNGDSDTWDE